MLSSEGRWETRGISDSLAFKSEKMDALGFFLLFFVILFEWRTSAAQQSMSQSKHFVD